MRSRGSGNWPARCTRVISATGSAPRPVESGCLSWKACQSDRVGRTASEIEVSNMAETTQLMVWIDQDLCTGDGICEEITPDVFVGRDDGLWVVKEESKHFGRTVVFDGVEGEGHGPEGS